MAAAAAVLVAVLLPVAARCLEQAAGCLPGFHPLSRKLAEERGQVLWQLPGLEGAARPFAAVPSGLEQQLAYVCLQHVVTLCSKTC